MNKKKKDEQIPEVEKKAKQVKKVEVVKEVAPKGEFNAIGEVLYKELD